MWSFISSQNCSQEIAAVPQQSWWSIIRNGSGYMCWGGALSITVLVSTSSTHHFISSSSSLGKAASRFSTHSNFQAPWVQFGCLAWCFGCILCIPSQHLVVTTYPWLLPVMVHVPKTLSHATLILWMACFKWKTDDPPRKLSYCSRGQRVVHQNWPESKVSLSILPYQDNQLIVDRLDGWHMFSLFRYESMGSYSPPK